MRKEFDSLFQGIAFPERFETKRERSEARNGQAGNPGMVKPSISAPLDALKAGKGTKAPDQARTPLSGDPGALVANVSHRSRPEPLQDVVTQ
jgi:hypothetical protein